MAHQPQFSIIIPALNEERYLPHLLADLSNQTFRDFEVIVVDGKSDDQTVAKAKLFKSKLPSLTILTSPKRHVCTQRNLGAASAKADILIFSDADNRLPPYFLQGLKYRWEESGADILSTYFEPDVKTPKNITIASAVNLFHELQMSIKPTYLFEGMIIVSLSAFSKIGGFDENIHYAEGKNFIQTAIIQGFKPLIIRDPIYTLSFRRLRKYGTINLAARMAKLEISRLFGSQYYNLQAKSLYPLLGGSPFAKSRKIKNKFLKNVAKLLKDF